MTRTRTPPHEGFSWERTRQGSDCSFRVVRRRSILASSRDVANLSPREEGRDSPGIGFCEAKVTLIFARFICLRLSTNTVRSSIYLQRVSSRVASRRGRAGWEFAEVDGRWTGGQTKSFIPAASCVAPIPVVRPSVNQNQEFRCPGFSRPSPIERGRPTLRPLRRWLVGQRNTPSFPLISTLISRAPAGISETVRRPPGQQT
jgi:hypothetical protein